MIVGVLLAAGRSTRFTSQKLMATLPDGKSLLEASAASLRESISHVVIVSRPNALNPIEIGFATAIAANLDCAHVVNMQAAEGMGTSIARGVRYWCEESEHHGNISGVVIALGDMPYIAPGTTARVRDEMALALSNARDDVIIVPTYRRERGHPVGFGAQHLPALMSLEGDQGARSVVNGAADRVIVLETDDSGVVRDIDTPADLPR
jgi:molybdenum cofactor cytidylyltransferase